MTMFCFQCQETLRNQACAQHGMCGKTSDCSNLMDALIYALRGLAAAVEKAEIHVPEAVSRHIQHALFVTLTLSSRAVPSLLYRKKCEETVFCTGQSIDEHATISSVRINKGRRFIAFLLSDSHYDRSRYG